MSIDSPASILYSSDGYELTVTPGSTVPSYPRSILNTGSDGTNVRIIKVDSSGRIVVSGAGTAGSPIGGLITIQGDPSGTPVPISGSIAATNPSVSSNNSAIPSSSTQIGGSDGTNLQAIRVFDLDTGAGTQYSLGVNLRKSASGGSVEFGTSLDPIRTDPTGTTTQPISATSLPLPTGAATESTLSTLLLNSTFTSRINTLGQKTMANSTPVVLASDQSTISISGTVTANQGTPNTLANAWSAKITDATNGPVAVKASSTAPVAADQSLVVNISPNRPATYAASTNGNVAISTNATGVTSIAYIFHTSTNTKRIEIYRIVASAGLETGANHDFTLRGAFITAENATPGGTIQSVNPFDNGDVASTITGTTGTFRTGATGAPARTTGDLISEEMYINSAGAQQKILFDIHFTGKPIVLRAGQNEGFEIRSVGGGNGNLTQAVEVTVTMYWMEI